MSNQKPAKEELILRAVKKVLTNVIKDTATRPGMIHPLKEDTIAQMRECLLLISDREQELAEAAGRPMNLRPRFTDQPQRRDELVVPLDTSGLTKNKPKD